MHYNSQKITVLFLLTTLLWLSTSPTWAQQENKNDPLKIPKLQDLNLDYASLAGEEIMNFHYYSHDSDTGRLFIAGSVGFKTTWKNNRMITHDWGVLGFPSYGPIYFDLKIRSLPGKPLIPAEAVSNIESNTYAQRISGMTLTVDQNDNAVYKHTRGQTAEDELNEHRYEHPKNALADFHLFRLVPLLPRKAGYQLEVGQLYRAQAADFPLEYVQNVHLTCIGKVEVALPEKGIAKWWRYDVDGVSTAAANYGFSIYVDDKGELRRIVVNHLGGNFFERMAPIKPDPADTPA